MIDRPEISEHVNARIPEAWDTMRYDKILCTADFNWYTPAVHEGDIKCAVDESNMRR